MAITAVISNRIGNVTSEMPSILHNATLISSTASLSGAGPENASSNFYPLSRWKADPLAEHNAIWQVPDQQLAKSLSSLVLVGGNFHKFKVSIDFNSSNSFPNSVQEVTKAIGTPGQYYSYVSPHWLSTAYEGGGDLFVKIQFETPNGSAEALEVGVIYLAYSDESLFGGAAIPMQLQASPFYGAPMSVTEQTPPSSTLSWNLEFYNSVANDVQEALEFIERHAGYPIAISLNKDGVWSETNPNWQFGDNLPIIISKESSKTGGSTDQRHNIDRYSMYGFFDRSTLSTRHFQGAQFVSVNLREYPRI